MRKPVLFAVAAALASIAGIAWAATNLANFSLTQAANMTRPCVLKPAGAVEIGATAAASATSSQLSTPSVYYIKCDTAAYVDTSATSTCTAASGDFKLPADTLLPLVAIPDADFVCARNVTADGSCWLLECL